MASVSEAFNQLHSLIDLGPKPRIPRDYPRHLFANSNDSFNRNSGDGDSIGNLGGLKGYTQRWKPFGNPHSKLQLNRSRKYTTSLNDSIANTSVLSCESAATYSASSALFSDAHNDLNTTQESYIVTRGLPSGSIHQKILTMKKKRSHADRSFSSLDNTDPLMSTSQRGSQLEGRKHPYPLAHGREFVYPCQNVTCESSVTNKLQRKQSESADLMHAALREKSQNISEHEKVLSQEQKDKGSKRMVLRSHAHAGPDQLEQKTMVKPQASICIKSAEKRTPGGSASSPRPYDTQSKKERTQSEKKTKHAKRIKSPENVQSSPKKIVPKRQKRQTVVRSSSRDSCTEVTVLSDWIIKPLPDIKGVCVEGQKKGQEDFWHSTAIVSAHKPRLVSTVSGSVYALKGKINKLCTIENGFTREVAVAFADGFPTDWKQVLKTFYDDLEESIAVEEEFSPLRTKQTKVKVKASRKHLRLDKQWSEGSGQGALPDCILTPTGLIKRKIEPSTLKVTRSGRVSLPPLAGWMGQSYCRDPRTNSVLVNFQTNEAEKALSSVTRNVLSLPKRAQEMISKHRIHFKTVSPSSTGSTNHTPAQGNISDMDKARAKCTTSLNNVPNLTSPSSPLPSSSSCVKDHVSGRMYTRSSSKKLKTTVSRNDVVTTEKKKRGVQSASKQGKIAVALNNFAHCEDQSKENLVGFCPASVRNTPFCARTEMMKNGLIQSPKVSLTRLKDITEAESVGEKSSVQEVTEKNKTQSCGTSQSNPSTCKNRNKRKRKCPEDDVENVHGNARRGCTKRAKLTEGKADSNGAWSKEEVELFHRAIREVASTAEDYWGQVALRVSSRSQWECVQYNAAYLDGGTNSKGQLQGVAHAKQKKPCNREGQAKGRTTGQAKEGGSSQPIQGGKGTLKRKEAIRNFLNEQNEDYEDDLFEASPFRDHKTMSKKFDVSKNDSEIFGPNPDAFTPMTSRSLKLVPGTGPRLASAKRTPACWARQARDTPASSRRRFADRVIRNFNLQKKSTKGKIPDNEAVPNLDSSMLPIKSLFSPTRSPMIQIHEAEEEREEEEESPYMYYWNEEV